MRKSLLVALAIATVLMAHNVSFGQTVQVVRMDGTYETFQIRQLPTEPKTIRIPPYGLNLQPANLPQRPAAPITFDAYASATPVIIDNPYYVSPKPSLTELFFRYIGVQLARSCN